MKCASCGAEMATDQKFCTNCGAPASPPGFCPNCGARLAPGARFCGGCGTTAGLPTAKPAAPAQTLAPPPPSFAPAVGPAMTASDVVYLYGDSFVEKDNMFTAGLTLESSGVKIQKKPLARMMVLAALAQLVREGWIDLPLVKMGFAVFKTDTPIVQKMRSEPCPLGGLEKALYQRIDPRGDWQNSLGQVLGRVVSGGEPGSFGAMLSQFATVQVEDPWAEVVGYARGDLVSTGHLILVDNPAARGLGRLVHSKYRMEPNPSLIAQSRGQVMIVRSWIDNLRALDPRRYDTASKHIDQTLDNLERKDDDSRRGMIKIG